jgi:hypothetical protein
MDEDKVERMAPGRNVIHNEHDVGIYQQQGENAEEDSRHQECLENLEQVK